jgi:S1-C subfamily serine protease
MDKMEEKSSPSVKEKLSSGTKRLWWGLKKAVPFAMGVLAALTAFWLYNTFVPHTPPLTTRDVNNSIAQAMASATPPPAFSEQVYQAVRPSLVLILTKDTKTTNGKEGGSLGTGMVVDDAGDVLTALHVVAGAADIQLTFADGTQSSAQVISKVPANDIAVLQPSKLPKVLLPVVLGNPNAMRIGDEAYIVGNPFGLYGSMSSGVISGLNRSFQPPNSGGKIEGLIQLDAAANPGNSGGPLLNRYGQVIGVVVGLANPTDQDFFVGISFAVPINVAGGAAGLPPD